jgi:hypothetical protein
MEFGRDTALLTQEATVINLLLRLTRVVWLGKRGFNVIGLGASDDANSGSFITSETSGVKLRHRKVMTAYFFNSG